MSSLPSAPTRAAPLAKLRDLAVRTAVGAILIALIALSLWLWHWGLVILIAAILGLGAHELGEAAALKGRWSGWPVVAVGGPVLIVVEYTGWFGDVLTVGLVGCTALVLVTWAWRLFRPVDGFLADVGSAALIVVYLPLLLTFVIAMLRTTHPVAQMATYGVCIVVSDTGAYVVGSLIGRHKMSPNISPSKTWEGFVGGVVWAGAAGALMCQFFLHQSWWQGLVMGVVLGVCAALGDLIESAIKRDVGVKDMGKLLPGHGGAMDRLDSLAFCAPIAWAFMNLWMGQA
ncbi:MAG: phosphatidate cytidylyltransferase [Propionibacteriaceae bacterium]|nr:phosphatidate cytidylyltransferase [Propionibacteriaceae bacterium]